MCDCELSHNGFGMSGRICDCPAGTRPVSLYELVASLKSFVHLAAYDDEGPDLLRDLPDSHVFELTWAAGQGDDAKSDYPMITAGQIRRARAVIAALGLTVKE